MQIIEHPSSARVIFGSGAGIRSKMAFACQMLAFASVAALCLWWVVAATLQGRLVSALFAAGMCTVLLIICWRFMARITRIEELHLTADTLCLIRYENGRKRTAAYPVAAIENLCFVGSDAVPVHALQSDNLDALGFGARQQLVHAATAEGNVAFYCDGRQVRFGSGLSSWNAERLDQLLRVRTGGALSMAGLPEDIPESVWNAGSGRS